MIEEESVHLQPYPKIKNFETNYSLIDMMDKVKELCGSVLSIRDKNNLRIRLPLNKVTVISKESDRLKEYSSIILDETNIKNIEFENDIENFANKKIILNFKKVGERIGSKMSNIMINIKNNKWEITKENKLKICDFEFDTDEYSCNYEVKRDDISIVQGYDILFMLDLNVTEDLEKEGLARDIIRSIQQYRKDVKLNVSDKINLFIKTDSKFLKESIELNRKYIEEQTLTNEITFVENEMNAQFSFWDDVNNKYKVQIGLTKINK